MTSFIHLRYPFETIEVNLVSKLDIVVNNYI